METDLSEKDLIVVLKAAYSARTKWYNIGLELGVQSDTLDSIRDRFDDPIDCLREVLRPWLRGISPRATWRGLIDALRSCIIGEEKLASELEAKYCTTAAPDPTSTSALMYSSQPYVRLQSTLREIHRFKRKGEIAEEAFEEFAASSLNAGLSTAQILAQLEKLHRDEFLLSADLYKQAKEVATRIYAESAEEEDEHVSKTEQSTVSTRTEPLFCKDTVYHAGICSLAVSTCDAGNLLGLFKDREKVPGHSFREVSISRSKQDRYLVARQGESTFYFAFQSEPRLPEWAKKFKSFYEGVKAQSKKFPVRFIVELLNKRNYVVLTGFSFGGLLASVVAAMVWNTPYMGADLLKSHLVCITFGQPHVTVPLLADVARQRAELASTIHCVYSQDDMVPRLMKFLDESWNYLTPPGGKIEGKPSLPVNVPVALKAPFHDPLTSLVLERLGKLQESASNTEVFQELQSQLAKLTVIFEAESTPLTTCTTPYLMSNEEGGGLVFNKMTLEQATRGSSYLQLAEIEQLQPDLFKQHSMTGVNGYCQKLFHAFLDKAPKYALPPWSKHTPGAVGLLRPSIEAVELQHHGSEKAVALEGRNLWFCYQVSVGGHTVKTPPQDLSGTSIQFNIPQSKAIATDGGIVKVTTQSYFNKPVKYEVSITEKKGFDISTRQQQLARLTPSTLIELAYLSALLEQHPCRKSEPLSYKVEVIRKFLEEVVHVVPIESIAYAVAYCPYEIAMLCYRALRSTGVRLPCSVIMSRGLGVAVQRLTLGVPPRLLRELQRKITKENPKMSLFTSEEVLLANDEVQLICQPRFPGSILPSSPHAATATMKLRPEEAESTVNIEAGRYLKQLSEDITLDHERKESTDPPLVSGQNIDLLYPVSSTYPEKHQNDLKSPIHTLASCKKKLASLAKQVQETTLPMTQRSQHKEMLGLVNDIRSKELVTCTSLLSGFMEQEIDIPLMKSCRDESEAVEFSAQATIGVWALFSLKYSDIQPILAQCHGDQLLVKIEEYVKAVVGAQSDASNSQYAAKLQFLVQGMEKTVTCNSQHVSYSLERQLTDLCENQNVDLSLPLDSLLMRWGKFFKEQTLSLVARSHRPLIARWLKWSLMVHNLREELAKYTAVGVTGLVNSGKSLLVSTLFGVQIAVGTSEAKRTTVPFMYNLDEHVEGLDVVDFPGVDDEDDSIPDLADLLLTIAQIVIFVVDYRKVHTQSAKKWLERLQEEKMPVLVCLTFADKFYAEHMTEDGKHPGKKYMQQQLKEQLSETKKKLGSASSRIVKFFSFSQDRDSVLNTEEGRQRLRDVGIGTPLEVGDWLVDVFRKDFKLEGLADQLDSFIHKPD